MCQHHRFQPVIFLAFVLGGVAAIFGATTDLLSFWMRPPEMLSPAMPTFYRVEQIPDQYLSDELVLKKDEGVISVLVIPTALPQPDLIYVLHDSSQEAYYASSTVLVRKARSDGAYDDSRILFEYSDVTHVSAADIDHDGTFEILVRTRSGGNEPSESYSIFRLVSSEYREVDVDPDETCAPAYCGDSIWFRDVDGDGRPELVCGVVWDDDVEPTLSSPATIALHFNPINNSFYCP